MARRKRGPIKDCTLVVPVSSQELRRLRERAFRHGESVNREAGNILTRSLARSK